MKQRNPSAEDHKVIIAGFGGQGVLTAAKLLCTAALNEGKHVTYVPSYGSEVRGGTANCHVIISRSPIFSPLVEEANSLIILNQPSYDRFAGRLAPGGLLVINSSLIAPPGKTNPTSRTLEVPATGMAAAMGNVLVANTVMLGALVGATGICNGESLLSALEQALASKARTLLDLNREAYAAGVKLAGNAQL